MPLAWPMPYLPLKRERDGRGQGNRDLRPIHVFLQRNKTARDQQFFSSVRLNR